MYFKRSSMLVLLAALFMSFTVAQAFATDPASIARGGKLYDKWYAVTGADKPSATHKAWPSSNTKKKGAATNRCKSCHGWDFKGKDGAYASGSYKTGITGVRKFAGGDPKAVIAIMKDATHGYADLMDPKDFADLAAFVTEGQLEMNDYIDFASKKVKGDAAKGSLYYGTICAGCHDFDGRKPKDMPLLGKLANKNPWEILQKIQNGQPKEQMPALRALDMQISVDILAHLQTLPVK